MNVSSSSSSSYVTGASSNKGFSGLVSGMDTESMVESMLSGTQSKIDKQTGLKQQLEWKQEIYRDIITQINDFQSRFFSSTSTTSLLSQTFYNAMSAITSSSAFKVTASSSAATGSTKLQVRQLATNSSLTSGAGVSGKLSGSIDAAKMQELIDAQLGDDAAYTVKFQMGSDTVEVNLRDIFVADDGKSFKDKLSGQELDKAVEDKLNAAFKDKGVTAQVKDGALTLTANSDSTTIKIASDSGSLGLARLGLTVSSSSTADTKAGTSVMSGKVSDADGLEFTVTLDDITKTVELDWRSIMTDGAIDTGKFRTQLQTALDSAHGSGQITVVDNGSGFELKVSAGRKVMVGGSSDVMASMNLLNGQSNRIGMGGELEDLYFATALQGSEYRFSINGVDFHFTSNNTMSEIMSAINKSGAGVRLVYRTQDDTFTLEATDSGAGRTISLSQTEGNLLNALFGSGADGALAAGSSASSKTLTMGKISGNMVLADDEFSSITQGTMTLSVNGTSYTLSLEKKEDGSGYTKQEILDELNSQLDSKFGAGNLHFEDDGTLTVNNGAVVSVVINPVEGDDADAIKKAAQSGDLGIAFFGNKTVSNEVTGDTTLGELGITGLKASDGSILGADVKLSELSSKNSALNFENGKIRVTGSGAMDIADADTMKELFGTDSLTLGQVSGSLEKAQAVEGQNAIVEIDGLVTERSSNTFSVNGLNFTLSDVTGSYGVMDAGQVSSLKTSDGQPLTLQEGQYIESGVLYNADGTRAGQEKITYTVNGQTVTADNIRMKDGVVEVFNGTADSVQVNRNTDQIVDGIKDFIDEYNKLIKTLNDYLDEDTSYKDYAPLTDAQKKEMSDSEIELWEEKAKEGLLHRDSTIDSFLQSMRTALYEKPAGCAYALYDLGIETGEWESKGQLVMSSDGEARLRQILESDPESVMELFTDSEEGIFTKINSIMDDTAKISSGSPGTLVELAGVKGKASENNNTLYSQIKDIDDRIAALKETYEKEKNRYWSEFNTMEQLISNMNTQSSWLSQQFSSL